MIGVDAVYAPWTEDGYGYIVFARDDLSGWVEGKALKEATAKEVAKFIYQDVICRHGCPRKVVVDGNQSPYSLRSEVPRCLCLCGAESHLSSLIRCNRIMLISW